ncbi:MAG: DUF5723 family protein, partial [Melioribacteraceae bacterium]|nr:DUF5723 family protein [Melioribacteraceae bacterium]
MKKLVILVFLILAAEISAQGVGSIGVSDARSNSLGNSYTVTSRGVYAIHKNPANLALPSDETIQLATVFPLPNLNFAAGTDFMTLEDINYYFGGVTGPNGQTVGRLLTDADKRNLVSLFDDGSRMRGSVNLNLFSLSVNAGEDIGSFAFSIGDRISVSADIPKGLVEFAMFGNETGVEYQFNDLNARSWYLRDYSLSYARQINDLIPALDIGDYIESLTVGVTLKMVQGLAYTNMDRI